MGAIRKIINDLDPTSEELKEQRATLEALTALAETKAEFFELDIRTGLLTAGSKDNQTVPIEAVIASTKDTHAYSKKDQGQIGSTVKTALKSFCSGTAEGVRNGVGDTITNLMTDFLGASEGDEHTLQEYYVMAEDLSIIRVDLRAWRRSITTEGLSKKVEQVCAYVLVKSTADLSKIKFNTFLSLYSRQLREMGISQEHLEKAIADARAIYRSFNEASVQPTKQEAFALDTVPADGDSRLLPQGAS